MDSTTNTLLLSILVLANIFSIYWALSVQRKLSKRPTPKIYEVKVDADKLFSQKDMGDIQAQAHKELEDVAKQAAARLQQSLNNTVDEVADRISDSVENSISQEFEKYQVSLEALREQTIEDFSKLQRELEDRRAQLTEQLDRKIAQEYLARMGQFNARISDVVSSYLAESLGNEVDLGAQGAYILRSLEDHKEDMKKDILV